MFVVSLISIFMSSPSKAHMGAEKSVLSYIVGHWISDLSMKNNMIVNLFLILTVIGPAVHMTGKALQAML